jgi:hypothetical protein
MRCVLAWCAPCAEEIGLGFIAVPGPISSNEGNSAGEDDDGDDDGAVATSARTEQGL